jgi:superfamily II DNA or RNA helicase
MSDAGNAGLRLAHGIYEHVINRVLDSMITIARRESLHVEDEPLDPGDSHAALARYMEIFIRGALDAVDGCDRLAQQVELCNQIVDLVGREAGETTPDDSRIDARARRLLAVSADAQTGPASVERPDTPLSVGCLLTGTRVDPSLVSQLRKEIRSATRIDILCSFIKWGGVRILENELREFTRRPGATLRVITTSYLGATDIKAIDFLQDLPNTALRVSYDTHRTRLHAKAYTFERATGFGTAYIGSANLSHAALTDGLEWNIKVSQYESPHLWEKVRATFETYWNDSEFTPYSAAERERLSFALEKERGGDPVARPALFFDLQPFAFQKEILDQLRAEREVQGRERHLVVAATGTGKTMIAAFDYRDWCRGNPHRYGVRPRLLFVAHREEILRQSLAAFRAVLRDQNFGELLVGGATPGSHDHLFVSVQSYESRELWREPGDHYDYVVVDEFHHAAANSYQRLLSHVRPKVLLGLTATPDRADGLDVLGYFGGHLSAEIRLPDAINRKLLCPFQYFGISDSVDLADVAWRRGGYDTAQLDGKYTGNDIRAGLIVEKATKILADVRKARGLAFCVSIAHANYMAEQFRRHGIPAEALSAESGDADRRSVQDRLRRREINFICVVDLYNEGVDIPEVDTVLFLRPTESLTVFLQQLGRGLRLNDEKECLTVLDFIGAAHRSYRFDLRFKALLNDPLKGVQQEIEEGFCRLPAGCTIQLEPVARQHVLENIRQALRQTRNVLVGELAQFAAALRRRPTMGEFLDHYQLDTDDVYRRGLSWSRLCFEAKILPALDDPDEERLTAGLRRFQHVDDPVLIRRLLEFCDAAAPALTAEPSDEADRRRLLIQHFSVWGRDSGMDSLAESVNRLARNPYHRDELEELLRYRLGRVTSVAPTAALPFLCPLTLHASYTRDEILAALGVWTLSQRRDMREGVLYVRELPTDLFLFTLNKTEKEYSPTTMYQDYAIGEDLFHWQSQSTTSETSPTGRRYVEQRANGHTVLLFAREDNRRNGLACPYSFLGPADYVSHAGSRPMSIVWKLRHALPAKLYRRFARLAI